MPDDPIIDAPPAPGKPSHAPLQCEFCGCTVSRHTGQMVRRSERATAMMNLDTENGKLKQRIADLETALSSAQSEVAELKARVNAPPIPRKRHFNLDERETAS